MLSELTILLALCAPQGSEAERKAGLEPISYGSGGWPILKRPATSTGQKQGPERGRKSGQRTPFDPPERSNSGGSAAKGLKGGRTKKGSSLSFEQRRLESVTPIPGEVSQLRKAQTKARKTSGRSTSNKDLHELFRSVGSPDDFTRLIGLHVKYGFRVLTEDGRELGLLNVQHRMDLRRPRRDRLMFESDLVYGRDDAVIFVEQYKVPRPSRVGDARDELALIGLLARFPWCFADETAFVVEAPEELLSRERRKIYKIHIESRGSGKPDVYDIYCDERYLPQRLIYTLAATGSSRTVELSDYRNYGRVRIAGLRKFLDGSGRPALEIGIQLLTTGIKLHEAEFHATR